jgi:hypothetical protein
VVYPTELGDMLAWHLPAVGATWVIHVHGKGATPAEAENLFAPLQQAGYPQLAISYRNDDGQPEDPSGYYQYGATEWEDVAAAVDFARANGADDVVLSGFSTGGAHILSYLYRHDIDDVKGAVLDSPNLDLGEAVDYAASMRDMPVIPINVPITVSWVAKFMTSLRIGVNWKTIDYVARAQESLRVPVLIHHGTDDKTVPYKVSEELEDASPDLVTLIPAQGADHVGAYDADPSGYVDSVLAFLAEVS